MLLSVYCPKFDSGYATRGINHDNFFMKLTTVENFIKLFWYNLCFYWHIALCFVSCYVTRSVNYDKKFIKLATGVSAIKLFFYFSPMSRYFIPGGSFQPSLTFQIFGRGIGDEKTNYQTLTTTELKDDGARDG
jgi:hypothetical protein